MNPDNLNNIREFTIAKISNLLKKFNFENNLENIAKELEIEVYRATLKNAEDNCHFRSWQNDVFRDFYTNKMEHIMKNIDIDAQSVNNKTLLFNIINHSINFKDLPYMSPEQIDPEHWRLLTEENLAKESVMNSFKEQSTDEYECHKCYKRRCTFHTAQTRSADEAMTVFLCCLECGNKWTVND